MPSLDWTKFDSLPGSKSQNFENLCRALIRLHFGRYGQFSALKNQPGVEFHLKLSELCLALGGPPRWYGWQCKLLERTKTGDLRAVGRKDIEDSLEKAEKHLTNLTDWVLWTPYTLSKNDQEWFKSLQTKFQLHQWTGEEIDTYLSGPGLILRSTYFGDLIATPEELERRHREAIQPIRERWLESVHQSVEAERTVRRMLGEPGSWGQMVAIGQRLTKAVNVIWGSVGVKPSQLKKAITPFTTACSTFADTLLHFHGILADGDLDVIRQKLAERKTLIDAQVHLTPRRLRAWNLSIALDATNALDDMRMAQKLLDEVEEFLGVGLVAVLADAGGGKTQLAAQLTAPQRNRPAGVLLHGRDLHRGQTLDDLARHFSIGGSPMTSMERLLATLDAAGKRAKCRLPVVIDGLNEAENPKDWKGPIAVLSETTKSYPNVLVICTLRTGEHRRDDQMWRPKEQTNARELFAVMALPDGVRKIESEGFGGDARNAIKKYFEYFKINPGDAEIPVEALQHPLTLRIFCEVMNPKRESEVKVDYFPALLSPLFEKYVANACERISQMTNLSYSYTVADLEVAVYQLGLELWKAKKHEVKEPDYKAALSGTAIKWDRWDSNIVNLLAQEGVVFRNPGIEPEDYVITPTYSALGGYIIANSLLRKYARESTFDWLKKPEVIESILGEDSHQLAFDIFKSLVALVPRRMHGRQLWKEAPDPFRNIAVWFTTELEAGYLDKDTVAALLALLRDRTKRKNHLFSRLQVTRGAENHPLNSDVLDSALREMSVSDRDLSWTEWVRGTRSERFNDLLTIERRWKGDLATRTASDRLRAKWVMWLLTSTDHELRDVATRALYWYGRGAPDGLFAESLGSLGINDPYVSERMLAASYGVAMASHHERGFTTNILPSYTQVLYDRMFKKDAEFSTTHILARDYASNTIQIALLHNRGLITEADRKRAKQPFTDGGIRTWGESGDKNEDKYREGNYPFGFDFNNYTIGYLLPKRRNYDFTDREYIKVKSNMWWRIYQLGYSLEEFGERDKEIARQAYTFGRKESGGKIDRYGKKYCWIAWHEIAGFRQDNGLLKREWDSYDYKRFTVDIDPSFPDHVHDVEIIRTNYLGKTFKSLPNWISKGGTPDVKPYLLLDKIENQQGPWVLLDGFIQQEDLNSRRNIFMFPRGLFVKRQECGELAQRLRKQNLGGRWLAEIPEHYYVFAGEVPWCETLPHNGETKLSFIEDQ